MVGPAGDGDSGTPPVGIGAVESRVADASIETSSLTFGLASVADAVFAAFFLTAFFLMAFLAAFLATFFTVFSTGRRASPSVPDASLGSS